jgi:hypothetical protein
MYRPNFQHVACKMDLKILTHRCAMLPGRYICVCVCIHDISWYWWHLVSWINGLVKLDDKNSNTNELILWCQNPTPHFCFPQIRGPNWRTCNGTMSQRDCPLFGLVSPRFKYKSCNRFSVILLSLAMKMPRWDPKFRTNRLFSASRPPHYLLIILLSDGT